MARPDNDETLVLFLVRRIYIRAGKHRLPLGEQLDVNVGYLNIVYNEYRVFGIFQYVI